MDCKFYVIFKLKVSIIIKYKVCILSISRINITLNLKWVLTDKNTCYDIILSETKINK